MVLCTTLEPIVKSLDPIVTGALKIIIPPGADAGIQEGGSNYNARAQNFWTRPQTG